MKRKNTDIPSDDQAIKRKVHSKEETFQNDELFSKDKQNRHRPTNKFSPSANRVKTNNDAEELSNALSEIQAYYEKVLFLLKHGLGDEDREIFTNNVLEQAKGHEVALSCTGTSSYCVELLLPDCTDSKILLNFMQAFAEKKLEVCTNPNACHIMESLVYIVLLKIKNWSSILQSNVNPDEVKFITDALVWLNSFGDFCIENFDSILDNMYACYAFKIIIQALGGQYFDERKTSGKKELSHKAKFHEKFLGDENKAKFKTAIEHEQIPKFFMKSLKKIAKTFMGHKDLLSFVYNSSTAGVVEVLFMILKRRLPKYCKNLATSVSSLLLSEKDTSGVPTSFLDKTSSFVVEQIIKSSGDDFLEEFWQQHFVPNFECIVSHPVGNMVAQNLFNTVQSQTLFKAMYKVARKFFLLIFQSGFYGVFLSIANTCRRLKIKQAKFVKDLMKCLECYEPIDRQLSFVPQLLYPMKYDDYLQTNSPEYSFDIKICLHGSLIVQALLNFDDPKKVVNSLLNMRPEDFVTLADHKQGCYVLTSLFSKNSVEMEMKNELINLLKPVLPEIASRYDGSFTLARIWPLLSLEQRSVIAGQLSYYVEELQKTRWSSQLLSKFGVYYHNHNYEKWKIMQENFPSKTQETVQIICKKES